MQNQRGGEAVSQHFGPSMKVTEQPCGAVEHGLSLARGIEARVAFREPPGGFGITVTVQQRAELLDDGGAIVRRRHQPRAQPPHGAGVEVMLQEQRDLQRRVARQEHRDAAGVGPVQDRQVALPRSL